MSHAGRLASTHHIGSEGIALVARLTPCQLQACLLDVRDYRGWPSPYLMDQCRAVDQTCPHDMSFAVVVPCV